MDRRLTLNTVTLQARAKLNLVLSVGPPNPEGGAQAGWHPICSYFAPIDLADALEVTKAEATTYRIEWAADAPSPSPIDWPVEKDLAVRAHRAVEAWAGQPLPIAMHLRKRIPVGSGLGGGSSDAGAMVRALRRLYGLAMDEAAVAGIAAGLGSDVAFFADLGGAKDGTPRAAMVEGFGERVERVGSLRGQVVLVFPGFTCGTPEVYGAFDAVIAEADRVRRAGWQVDAHVRETRGEPRGREPLPHRVRPELVRSRLAAMGLRVDTTKLFNDLWPAAVQVRPALGELAAQLRRVTRSDVHLTGSGSCLFVVAERGEKTLEQCRRALGAFPGAAAVLASLV